MSIDRKLPFVTRRQGLATLAGLALTAVAGASRAHQSQSPLYPLQEKKRANAGVRSESQSSKSKKKADGLEAVIAKVDGARLKATMETLTAFGTRWSQSAKLVEARDFIRQQFIGFGYDASRIKLVEYRLPNGTVGHSVLCLPEQLNQGFILIGAHYDSISQTQATSATSAPGADDDGSGIAVVLEAARIFANTGLKRGVMFAAFGGEEQGLFGSQAVADLAASERWAIDVMLNLDMVAHVDQARPTNIVVEYDQGNADPRNDAAAKAFGLQMAQLVADYTSMTVEHTNIWSSDYMPFEAKGYPCIGLYDGGADAPFYHSTNDTMAAVNLPRLTEVAGLVCAFVASVAELKTS